MSNYLSTTSWHDQGAHCYATKENYSCLVGRLGVQHQKNNKMASMVALYRGSATCTNSMNRLHGRLRLLADIIQSLAI